MSDGIVQQQGTPFEIYHHPANLFVAEFIGDPRVNKIPGRVVGHDGTTVIDLGVCRVEMEVPGELTGRDVLASARPENITISREPVDDAFRANLEIVQPTGSETILQLRDADRLYTVLRSGFVQAEVDQTYWIQIQPNSINLFDPQSGVNLLPAVDS